jgi:YHS domain-containing protein
MSMSEPIHLPVFGSDVRTACGAEEKYFSGLPRAEFEGKWVFFCTPECQADFVRDPKSSCLADWIDDTTSD